MIFPTLDELEKSVEAGERYFQTADDPSQSEATVENCQKIIAVDPHAFIIERVDGQLAAYSSVLPTSNAVKNDFLAGKITERELLAVATSEPAFETLYLLVSFVLAEYRKRGIASRLVKEQIGYFKGKYGINDYYAWAWSEEGKKLISALGRDLKILIALPAYSK